MRVKALNEAVKIAATTFHLFVGNAADDHLWKNLVSSLGLLSKFLLADPDSRITIAEIKADRWFTHGKSRLRLTFNMVQTTVSVRHLTHSHNIHTKQYKRQMNKNSLLFLLQKYSLFFFFFSCINTVCLLFSSTLQEPTENLHFS